MAVDWDDKDELWAYILQGYANCNTYTGYSAGHLTSANYYWLAEEGLNAIEQLIAAGRDTNIAIGQLRLSSGWPDYNFALPYFIEHHLAAEVTWKQIVEAWIADDFEGRAVTIATIDRMRQILWDEPYRVVWAARPEEQEF